MSVNPLGFAETPTGLSGDVGPKLNMSVDDARLGSEGLLAGGAPDIMRVNSPGWFEGAAGGGALGSGC
jgi:hypothetical protein